MPPTRLPIKVVLPFATDYKRPPARKRYKIFDEDELPQHRIALSAQVAGAVEHFADAFSETPMVPVVARVTLKREALAKTHRPIGLLVEKAKCRVIGAASHGDLFIGAGRAQLELLADRIESDSTIPGSADVSTIERIAPYTAADVLHGASSDELAARLREERSPLKVKLFVHHDREIDHRVTSLFENRVAALSLSGLEELDYAQGARVFRVPSVSAGDIERLSTVLGVQSLDAFPRFHMLRSTSISLRQVVLDDFPIPIPGTEYGLVGVIDTGVAPDDPFLAPWVADRLMRVPESLRDHRHGSFVAALAIHARRLNKNDRRFPDIQSRIVDVAAVPRDGITEDQLIPIVEEALKAFPDVRVWNLSLAAKQPCRDGAFSDLAVLLDRLQDEHNVTFVIAAGNFKTPRLRPWPAIDLGEDDRICPPADSIRGLTVGGIAHLESSDSVVRREEPSPFTRRGPGPAFLPKPEVSHYAGNCSATFDYSQTGILSLNGDGTVAEDIGTSYAAPIVSALLAGIHSSLDSAPSAVLPKALVIHSAALGIKKLRAEHLRYSGFGIPGEITTVLSCEQSAATLIFEADIPPGMKLDKWPFPMPDCLRNRDGTIRGDFVMTLAYDPPLDASFGAEYCRRNVDAALGTFDEDDEGKREFKGQVPPEPGDIRQRYERHLIEHGFKWAPVKAYRRSAKRIKGDTWRLWIKAQNRAEDGSPDPQHVALIVTIIDPTGRKPVYDEMVTMMSRLGWTTLDLKLRSDVRVRT